jgi:hypothetical protein
MFDNNLMSCLINQNSTNKTEIALSLTNAETGESVSIGFSVVYPAEQSCDKSCQSAAEDTCNCENIGLFNIQGEVMLMFTKSHITSVTSFSSL